MWIPATRKQHSREGLRYETDLNDKEWIVIAPHLPSPAPFDRPRDWTWREIVNAIFTCRAAGSPGGDRARGCSVIPSGAVSVTWSRKARSEPAMMPPDKLPSNLQ